MLILFCDSNNNYYFTSESAMWWGIAECVGMFLSQSQRFLCCEVCIFTQVGVQYGKALTVKLTAKHCKWCRLTTFRGKNSKTTSLVSWSRHKQLISIWFPVLSNALVFQTCWYTIDNFLSVPFLCMLLHTQSRKITNTGKILHSRKYCG